MGSAAATGSIAASVTPTSTLALSRRGRGGPVAAVSPRRCRAGGIAPGGVIGVLAATALRRVVRPSTASSVATCRPSTGGLGATTTATGTPTPLASGSISITCPSRTTTTATATPITLARTTGRPVVRPTVCRSKDRAPASRGVTAPTIPGTSPKGFS